jgi:hypothetical protein
LKRLFYRVANKLNQKYPLRTTNHKPDNIMSDTPIPFTTPASNLDAKKPFWKRRSTWKWAGIVLATIVVCIAARQFYPNVVQTCKVWVTTPMVDANGEPKMVTKSLTETVGDFSKKQEDLLQMIGQLQATLAVLDLKIEGLRKDIEKKEYPLTDGEMARIAQLTWSNPVQISKGVTATPAEIIASAVTKGAFSPELPGYKIGPQLRDDGTVVAGVEEVPTEVAKSEKKEE